MRDFLDLCLTHYSVHSLCVFFQTSLSVRSKEHLPMDSPQGNFTAFVEWVLVSCGSSFTVCAAAEDVTRLTPDTRAHPASNNGHHRLHASARRSQGAQTDHSQSPTVCLNNNNVRANKRLFPSAKSPSPLMVPLSLPLPHPLPKTASALALLLLAPFSSSPPFLSTSRLFLGFSPPILHLGPSSLRIHGAPSSPPG